MITPSISSNGSHSQESILSSSFDRIDNNSSLYSLSTNNSSNTICTSSCCSSALSTTISGDINDSSPINSILCQQMSIQKQPLIMLSNSQQHQITEGNVFQNLNYNQQHLNPSAEQQHQQQLLQQQQFHFRMSWNLNNFGISRTLAVAAFHENIKSSVQFVDGLAIINFSRQIEFYPCSRL